MHIPEISLKGLYEEIKKGSAVTVSKILQNLISLKSI